MRRTPKLLVRLGPGLALAVAAASAQALEAFKIYDNFNAPAIDQAKWPGQLDRAREIQGKQLRLMARDYGGTASNLGVVGVSQHQPMRNPAAITEIRAKITVNNVEAIGCAANPEVTQSRARIYGVFFNTGAGAPGSLEGDIEAQMRLIRRSDSTDPPGVLRVDATVRRCNDPNCDSTTDLATADFGTATLGQSVLAKMQLDKANNRFLFSRDAAAPVALGYAVSDTLAAHAPYASASIRNTMPNCIASPRPTGAIDALFDDLAVNKSAVP